MSVVGFWICQLDYPALHLIVSHLREAICMRDWRVGCLRTAWFCFVTMRILTRVTCEIQFPNVLSGSKDDYNFFHSHVRIRVECAFGILVSRWGILRSAIPCNITIVRIIALVSCLARLHNFCINEVKRTKELDEDALPT